jgi:hypothetical protein
MSAAGLEVYDTTGALILTLSHRLARVLGSFNTGVQTAGSVTDAGLSTGTPFTIVLGYSAMSGSTPPIVLTVAGNTISWPAGPNSLVIYGVY